jgi:hypothetical protein
LATKSQSARRLVQPRGIVGLEHPTLSEAVMEATRAAYDMSINI